MFDRLLRPVKERALAPAARTLAHHASPNALSLAAFAFGVAAALSAARGAWAFALGAWALNRLLDGLDGTVARASGRATDFGGYLDTVLDTAVYALLPLGVALGVGTGAAYLAVAVLLGSFYVNGATWMYLAALLEKRGAGAAARGEMTSVTMPGGLVEGTESLVLFTLMLAFPAYATALFLTMAAAVAVTALGRVAWAAQALR